MYITAIDNIQVLQDNNSTLKVTNKSASRKDIKRGKNKQIDLGEGSKNLTTSIIIKDEDTFLKIFKILSKKRRVTFTDKFLGDIKVYIKSYTIINSDKHVDYTKIDITFNIEEDFNPKINYKGNILHNINILENNKLEYMQVTNNLHQPMQIIQPQLNNIQNISNIKSDYLNKLDEFNRYINRFELCKLLNYRVDFYIKPFKTMLLDNITSIKKALFTNININSIFIHNKLIKYHLRELLEVKDSFALDNIKNNLISLLNANIELSNNILIDYKQFDFQNMINDIINYTINSDLQAIKEITTNNYLNIPQWCYKYYRSLDNVNNIKYINNTHIDIIAPNSTFKYFGKGRK